jgi:hypothetical protein
MNNKLKLLALDIPTIQPSPGATELDPQDVVTNVIEWGLWFVGAIALVFVVYGGILYITSGGDSEKTTQARNTLLYSILGIIVVVVALFIINWAKGGAVEEITAMVNTVIS